MLFEILIKIFVFLMGLIVGSFLNVCIFRLPKNESIVSPPSHCTNCGHEVLWHDNIPLLSYAILGGKCRFCKKNISFRYFLVEALTATLALLLFSHFGLTAKFFAYAVLVSGLIVATFVDFEIQEIPDQVSVGGAVAGLVIAFAFPSIFDTASRLSGLLDSFMGAIVGALSIYLMGAFGKMVFKKEAMGGGDVKLMAMIGAFLGWKQALLIFFMTPFFGGIVGLAQKLKDGRDIIPYGPYLSLAALIAIFFGSRILNFFMYGFF